MVLYMTQNLAAQTYIPVVNRSSSNGIKSLRPCASHEGYSLPLCTDLISPQEVVYYYDILHGPHSIRHRQDPFIALDVRLRDQVPDFSVIVSIHNQAPILKENLACLLATTMGLWELVLVFDDCSDDSLGVAMASLRQHVLLLMSERENIPLLCHGLSDRDPAWPQHQNMTATSMVAALIRARLVVQPSPVWESSSDNIGLRSSSPRKYYVLVQPDMKVQEIGYNMFLTAPGELFPDIFAVSGRCAHNADGGGLIGRCGADVGQAMDVQQRTVLRRQAYLRDICIRGPLALKADRVLALGFLDEHNFHLGEDDHELCLRAYNEHAWRCAFFAIDFFSPFQDGTTRKTDDLPPDHTNKVIARLHLEHRTATADRRVFNGLKEQFRTKPTVQEAREVSNAALSNLLVQWQSIMLHTKFS